MERGLRTGLVAVSVVAATVVTLGAQLRTFQLTDEGDWRTTINLPDGTSRVYTFVPATKFRVAVAHEFAVVEPKRGVVEFTYHIANDSTSAQPIVSFLLNPGNRQRLPAELVAQPDGWEAAEAGAYVGFGGIRPGASTSLAFRAQGLPGVVMSNLSSSVDLLDVPDGLTDRQRDELEFLSLRNTGLDVQTIGPSIKVTGATWNSVVENLLRHYRLEFERARHPLAGRLSAVNVHPKDRTVVRVASELAAIGRERVDDRWQHDLSMALLACANMLPEIAFPVEPEPRR